MTTDLTTPGSEGRELTAEEQEERAKECYAIEETIKASIAMGRDAAWTLAKSLYEFNEANGWTALGYENQGDWLAQPEIGMTRSHYFKWVRKWREMVINREVSVTKLQALDPSKIDIVLPAIENSKVKMEEALADVESLGARDLREKYTKPYQLGHKANGAGGHEKPSKGLETDDEPITAADVGKASKGSTGGEKGNGNGEMSAKDVKRLEKMLHAAAVVDSWIEVGGDRRKAQRNMGIFSSTHPLFEAIATVTACVGGEGGAPERKEGQKAWAYICRELGMEFAA